MPCLLEDLTLGLLNRRMPREEARRRALAALGEVGLEEYGGAPAAHLSLGQRKRASLALALAPEPELLVLDEPTAELDGRSVRRLAGLLRRLPGAHLVASHHLEFLRETADRLVVLGEGTVLAAGPASEILADRPLLEGAGLI